MNPARERETQMDKQRERQEDRRREAALYNIETDAHQGRKKDTGWQYSSLTHSAGRPLRKAKHTSGFSSRVNTVPPCLTRSPLPPVAPLFPLPHHPHKAVKRWRRTAASACDEGHLCVHIYTNSIRAHVAALPWPTPTHVHIGEVLTQYHT